MRAASSSVTDQRKLYARLDTALALADAKTGKKRGTVARDVWWESVATYAIPHSLMLTCFNCVKAYCTNVLASKQHKEL